jgi:glycosyltransferase involved in cell wall biosynthesis
VPESEASACPGEVGTGSPRRICANSGIYGFPLIWDHRAIPYERKTLQMRVSIITLTNDSSRYVDEAIGRVERGGLCELEHVVVRDGAEGFIERLAGRYPHLRLLRGNGTGAAAAAALGVRAATGDFILFVHSDDRICAEAIGQLAIQLRARPDIRIWSGGAQISRPRDLSTGRPGRERGGFGSRSRGG